jgi:hypothetical protein
VIDLVSVSQYQFERNVTQRQTVLFFVIWTNCFTVCLSCHNQEIEKLTCTIQMFIAQWLSQTKNFWIFFDIHIAPIIACGRQLLVILRCINFRGYLTWSTIWGWSWYG